MHTDLTVEILHIYQFFRAYICNLRVDINSPSVVYLIDSPISSLCDEMGFSTSESQMFSEVKPKLLVVTIRFRAALCSCAELFEI